MKYSEVLNYKRGFSRELIRKFTAKFGLSPESFFNEYDLAKESNTA